MQHAQSQNTLSVPGVLLTIGVTIGLLWSGWQWSQRDNWPPRLSIRAIQANEVQAFKHVQQFVQAQTRYREVDRDHDGRTTYAKFPAHLWMSVDNHNQQVPVNLIPRGMGFAMGSDTAVDGYYFRNFDARESPETTSVKKLDYADEWAMAAIPAIYRTTGVVMFIADQSGQVFVSDVRNVPPYYPISRLSIDWLPVDTLSELQQFQQTLEYAE